MMLEDEMDGERPDTKIVALGERGSALRSEEMQAIGEMLRQQPSVLLMGFDPEQSRALRDVFFLNNCGVIEPTTPENDVRRLPGHMAVDGGIEDSPLKYCNAIVVEAGSANAARAMASKLTNPPLVIACDATNAFVDGHLTPDAEESLMSRLNTALAYPAQSQGESLASNVVSFSPPRR